MRCLEALHVKFSKCKIFGSERILLFAIALANSLLVRTIAKGAVLHYKNKSRLRQTVTHAYTSQHVITAVLQPAYQKSTSLSDRKFLC